MALTDERAREIVAAVEAKNKGFHCLQLTVDDGKATVRFRWIDKPYPTAIMDWFIKAGARPMLFGRVLLDGDFLVDYGVIRFQEGT